MKNFALLTLALIIISGGSLAAADDKGAGMTKISDFIIYQDDKFYAAFPSLVVREDGEILCAFRRAPNRRLFGGNYSHTDANSYLVLVRSKDGGKTWSKDPELIYAHPMAGSQDPCMVQLSDGSIVCTSYAWVMMPPGKEAQLENTLTHPSYAFLGGYIVRSDDGGNSWKGPFLPPPLPGSERKDALGNPCPAFNRGAMIQRKDGRLYWSVAGITRMRPRLTENHLLISSDRGETWEYSCPVASDDKVTFNETSLIETAKGDIIAFMRTADFDGKLAFARSTDGGKSFGKWEDGGFFGHPFHAIRLKDDRIFLVYGYRKAPFGIRAKILNPDCTNIREAPEFVIRDDGGGGDIGYPWAALLPDGKILVAYYFNINDGLRHIAGSLISVD